MRPTVHVIRTAPACIAVTLATLLMLPAAASEHERASFPATDPVVAETTGFRQDLVGQHPRLLFTEAALPAMREFYQSEAARPYREHIEEYSEASVPPAIDEVEFPTNATDGQRQGYWRMPTIAMHYLMTGDEGAFERAVGFLELLLELDAWEEGGERNSGMSSANMLMGAALVYDWLYHDLDEEFRERMRLKIREMARHQYYGGHLRMTSTANYWQRDPQNNHRWKRTTGLALAAFVTYTGDPAENYLIHRAAEDVALIARWLPMDGSSHESAGYQVFGGSHLILGLQAADHCLGTDFLGLDYFKYAGYFRLLAMTSDLSNPLPFGDDAQGGFGSYANFYFLAAQRHAQNEVMGRLREWLALNPTSAWIGWLSLLWDDPDLGREPPENFPRIGYFPDVGSTYFHDSWERDGVSGLFRCGPLGGYALNDFRLQPDGSVVWVNVAHDDPDANSFILAVGNTIVAQTSGYSYLKHSANHNTILVNNMGQFVRGRDGSPMMWSQPADEDMSRMAYTTGWLHQRAITGIEGESAGAYPAFDDGENRRPALDRYRRSFFWVEGDYVLILDDIRAPEPVDITWLLQSEEVTPTDDTGRLQLIAGDVTMPAQVVSDREIISEIGDSPADHRREPLGWRQLQAVARASAAARFASVYDPWDRGLAVELIALDDDNARVIVTGDGFRDEWTWQGAPDSNTPSQIQGDRVEGAGNGGFPYDFSTAEVPDFRGPPVLLR